MALFLTHAALLLCASFGAARQLVRPWIERILGTVLLAWANIVVTSLGLSALRHLGEPAWFFRASLGLALATWLVLRRVRPAPVAPARRSRRPTAPAPPWCHSGP